MPSLPIPIAAKPSLIRTASCRSGAVIPKHVVALIEFINIDIGAAHRVADCLRSVGRLLADDDFLDDSGVLGHDGLFGGLAQLKWV